MNIHNPLVSHTSLAFPFNRLLISKLAEWVRGRGPVIVNLHVAALPLQDSLPIALVVPQCHNHFRAHLRPDPVGNTSAPAGV